MKHYQLGPISTPSAKCFGVETHFMKNLKTGELFEGRRLVKNQLNNMIGRRLMMDELRIMKTLTGEQFQHMVDFVNGEQCVLLILEKVTPHPNDGFLTTTLREGIAAEAAKQAKVQVCFNLS